MSEQTAAPEKTPAQKALNIVEKALKQAKALQSALEALKKDESVLMPKGSVEDRRRQEKAIIRGKLVILQHPEVTEALKLCVGTIKADTYRDVLAEAVAQNDALSADASGTAYEKLKTRFAMMANLSWSSSILSKLNEAGRHPHGIDEQIAQSEALDIVGHKLMTDPATEQWLDEAEKQSLQPEDMRNLSLMRRDWIRANCLSADLVSARSELWAKGGELHKEYLATGDWDKMKEHYRHSFDTMRKIAEAQQQKLGAATKYDALLDSFSPGLSTAHVKKEFAKLRAVLKPMLEKVLAKQASEKPPIPLTGSFPLEQQRELLDLVIKMTGFDTMRGRLDFVTDHPSTGGSPDDSRITTRFRTKDEVVKGQPCEEENFFEPLYSTAHEAGHGMYEQNTPAEHRGQPIGSTLGMAVHETQSMTPERCACKSPEFFTWLEKPARRIFNRPDDPALSADNMRRLNTWAQPSFIRIAADEFTYGIHPMIRFMIEEAVIEERITVDDIPQVWSDLMFEMLGIRPANAAEGWMQDIHWAAGLIGYFPAYTFGAAGAAQLYAAACEARPEIPEFIKNGDMTPLREWLRDNVHGKGSLLTADEMFTAATGEPLNMDHYLDYLSQRFLGQPYRPEDYAAESVPEKQSAKIACAPPPEA
jgi:carboxypeptidase Taq